VPAPFAAVVFDFGDTLFHSPSGVEALVEAGVDPARAGGLWEEVWAASKAAGELGRGRDLSAERHREAWLRIFARLEPYAPGIAGRLYDRVIDADRWLPYPDAAGVLRALRERGVLVGVLSNIPSALAPLFERHELARYVDAFVESFRHGREKPDLALFRTICHELRVVPSDALMVGDSHLSDGAAVLTGMTALVLPAVPPRTPRGLARVLDLCQ
jgi:putative hydrolase of the HAD superfamily